jgi:hypothetical protein
MDRRLCWQLGQALSLVPRLHFGDELLSSENGYHGSVTKVKTTISFASQLQSDGNLYEAIFVLLHIPPTERRGLVDDFLARDGGLFCKPGNDMASRLINHLKIAPIKIYRAKALYYRAVEQHPVKEFLCLLGAQDFEEANRTFLKSVAPRAVIERRYGELWELSNWLRKGRDDLPDWEVEAKVYQLFVAMQKWEASGGQGIPQVLRSLPERLKTLRERTNDADILEVAAIADMSEELARIGFRMWAKGDDPLFYRVAPDLPLTPDRLDRYLRDLELLVFQGKIDLRFEGEH